MIISHLEITDNLVSQYVRNLLPIGTGLLHNKILVPTMSLKKKKSSKVPKIDNDAPCDPFV